NGRSEQFFSKCAAKLGTVFAQPGFGMRASPQSVPGQREAVAVNAAALNPHHQIAGSDVLSNKQPFRMNCPDTGPDEVERIMRIAGFAQQFPDLRDFTSRNVDAGEYCAIVQTLGDAAEDLGL